MRFGADVNAYTSFDETVYMLLVPTDSVELVATAFQILEDWARGQIFDHEQIDLERGVVIEEWRSGQGAQARMFDEQLPILLKDSRYAERLPIGTKEILESFDYGAPKRFYRDWYRHDLMAVIAVGDLETATMEEKIHQHFASIASPEDPRVRPVYPVPDHEETLFAIATDEEATFNVVRVYWKQSVRDESTVGAYRQSVVESLFNAMLNARFFELTQKADPPFLGAFSSQGRLIRAKEFYFLGAGVANNGIERGLDALLIEAERVARHGFTESELEREKREILRGMERAYAEREKTNSEAYASEYVRAFLFKEPIPGVAYEFELYKRFIPEIQVDDVNQLAREWLADRNRVILVNSPEKEGVGVPAEEDLLVVFGAVGEAEITPYEDTAIDAPLVANVPQPADIVEEEWIEEIGVHRWELANGVRVLLKPTDFKDDEILFRAWSSGGNSLAADQDFVAASTASAVVTQGGVGEFSLVDLQKALAGKAVRVSPFIASLGEGMSGNVAPNDVETMFQLIYLYFSAPRKDTEVFESFRTRIQAALANRGASPEAAFQDTLAVTLAQHHLRARPATSELYEEMDLEESMAFYRDRFADASDFTFVFVGSFDPDSLRPLIQTYVGGLPSIGREESWRDVGMRPPTGVVKQEVFRGMEPKSQTAIVFTGPFDWNRDARYALRSMVDVLRINLREVLREDLGGTYGVSISGSSSRDPEESYSVDIGFGADPERLYELVDAAFLQIDSLQRFGPSQEDIDKVKEQQRRALETDLRRNAFWLGQLSSADRYGLDPRRIVKYEDVIDALDPETVRQAAIRYLRNDNYVQVSLFPEEQGAQ